MPGAPDMCIDAAVPPQGLRRLSNLFSEFPCEQSMTMHGGSFALLPGPEKICLPMSFATSVCLSNCFSEFPCEQSMTRHGGSFALTSLVAAYVPPNLWQRLCHENGIISCSQGMRAVGVLVTRLSGDQNAHRATWWCAHLIKSNHRIEIASKSC